MEAAGREMGQTIMSIIIAPNDDGEFGTAGDDGDDEEDTLDPRKITKILGDTANKGVMDDLTGVEDDQEGDGRNIPRPGWCFRCDDDVYWDKHIDCDNIYCVRVLEISLK